MSTDNENLRELVAEVAAAYFANSHVGVSEIPNVVSQIAQSLSSIGAPAPEATPAEAPAEEPQQRKLTSAQIRKSITPDHLISFEDNKPYKTLKRHLTGRGLTPEQYREKYSLPRDYPMVAPNYSAARSEMARNVGLGQKGRGGGASSNASGQPASAAPKAASGRGRGRRPAAAAAGE
jgi:predicted transcriptional regulator